MLPSSRPFDDFVPQPPYFRDAEPQFKCSTPACDATAWREEDFAKCESCGLRFCPDCMVKHEDLIFCPECNVCDDCGQKAVALCVSCGGLTCAADASPRGSAYLCNHCVADPGDLPREAYDPTPEAM